MVVIATTPPILSRNGILHLITNLGLKKVIEIGASDINDLICKAHGWKKMSIFRICHTGACYSFDIT